jgi:hypothetical protein
MVGAALARYDDLFYATLMLIVPYFPEEAEYRLHP